MCRGMCDGEVFLYVWEEPSSSPKVRILSDGSVPRKEKCSIFLLALVCLDDCNGHVVFNDVLFKKLLIVLYAVNV